MIYYEWPTCYNDKYMCVEFSISIVHCSFTHICNLFKHQMRTFFYSFFNKFYKIEITKQKKNVRSKLTQDYAFFIYKKKLKVTVVNFNNYLYDIIQLSGVVSCPSYKLIIIFYI